MYTYIYIYIHIHIGIKKDLIGSMEQTLLSFRLNRHHHVRAHTYICALLLIHMNVNTHACVCVYVCITICVYTHMRGVHNV